MRRIREARALEQPIVRTLEAGLGRDYVVLMCVQSSLLGKLQSVRSEGREHRLMSKA